MQPALRHPLRTIAVAAVAALLGSAVLAAAASFHTRGAVLAQLERPASFAGAAHGGRPANVVLRDGHYAVRLGLTPNRASVRNRLTLRLSRDGQPVSGVRVTIALSMPAMNMWEAFTTSPQAIGTGVYSSEEPVLGMPGVWQLRIHVASARHIAFSATFDDDMRN